MRKAMILGWTAVGIATLASSLWAFFGIYETFHEGWYFRSLSQNAGWRIRADACCRHVCAFPVVGAYISAKNAVTYAPPPRPPRDTGVGAHGSPRRPPL